VNYQRLAIGILAAISLLIGGWMYFFGPENPSPSAAATTGVLVRVGSLLGVIWLAMPQLKSMKTKFSLIAFLVLLVILIIAATRPKIFPIIAGLLAISLSLNWVLSWLSQFSGTPKK